MTLLFRVAGADDGLNVSPNMKITFDFDLQRIACLNEIFEEDIDDVLVKDFHFAKRIDVELQTFQLDASFVWNVFKPDDCEVREIREGTDRRELRHFKLDPDLTSDKLVREGIERVQTHFFTRRRLDIEAL